LHCTPYYLVVCELHHAKQCKHWWCWYYYVHPYVPKNPACRNDFMVLGSQIFISQTYKVMISLLLFFSYFPTSIRILVGKYYGCSNSIGCPVDGVEYRFSCFPLLYYDYWPVSKFRDPQHEAPIKNK
jgi:hypothetical protein